VTEKKKGGSPQGLEVQGDVGGSAQPALLVGDRNNRDRGLRGNPFHFAPQVAVDHGITDNQGGDVLEVIE